MSAEDDPLLDYAQWVLNPGLPKRSIAPRRSYFICGVPRSGTWLLSGLLESTGVAGHPHEYFWRDTERANSRNWRVSSFPEYISRVREVGTTENAVFACNLQWGYMTDLLQKLKGEVGADFASERSLIEHYFPRPRFVWVRREDVVAQAVSWAKALQTGYWHHWDSAGGNARFDFDQINALVRVTTEHNAAWRQWFAENGIEAWAVRFEDLLEEKERVTRQVLSFLGIAVPDDAVVAERTVKAGDALNEEWSVRYRLLTR